MKVRIPKQMMVLLYLPESAENERIRNALRGAGMPFCELLPQQLTLTVQECFEGKTTDSPLAEDAPQEAMAIFCNPSEAQLDCALAALRGLPVPLKAIMTPTNRDWNLLTLSHELCREREAIRRQKEQPRP